MNPIAKDLLQILALAVAIVGGLIAAFKALDETRENRRQRVRELRWKRQNSPGRSSTPGQGVHRALSKAAGKQAAAADQRRRRN
jgi:hypothetical protein